MRNFWLLVLGACTAVGVFAAEPEAVIDQGPAGKSYTINWTSGVISATGSGPLQEKAGGKRNRVLQRRVAVVDAYRQLAEAIAGVKITAETTVKEFQLADDTIRTKVDAFLKHMQVVRERWVEDDVYEVTIVAPLFGAEGKGLCSIVLPADEKDPAELRKAAEEKCAKQNAKLPEDKKIVLPPLPEQKVDIPATPPVLPTPTPTCQPGPDGKYTGVVIDTRGFHIERAMAPKIVDKDATPVWGRTNVTREFVIETGIVSYVPTMDMALNPNQSRAGKYPLVLRAAGREGSFRANAVLSDADVAKLKAENDKAKFLDGFKVVFVVD